LFGLVLGLSLAEVIGWLARWVEVRRSVRISNLSAHGVLVIGNAIPGENTPVVFRCNGLSVESWVAWVHPPHVGIQFGEPIRPEELLRNVSIPSAAIVRDTRKVHFRRPGFRGNQLTPEEREMLDEWRASSQAQAQAGSVRIKPGL
jgi:hypothetical protein